MLSPPIRRHSKHENLIRDLDFSRPYIGRNLSNTHVVAAVVVVVVVVVVHPFVFPCFVFWRIFFLVSALVCAFWFAVAHGRRHVFVCVCVCVCACVEKRSESSVRRIRLFISNYTRNRDFSLNAVFRIACKFEYHAASTLSCCLRVRWQPLARRLPQEKYCYG